MDNLYLIDEGCTVRKDNSQFLISRNGIKITSVPVYNVDKMLLFGNQQITTQAMSMAFEYGIDVLFLKANGRLKGKVSGTNSKNVFIRLAQYELWRKEKEKLQIAKDIVKGKIKNQVFLLEKYNQNVIKLKDVLNKVDKALNTSELMGYEGISSRLYFKQFKNIVPEPFIFEERNRRPPKDEVNALLSLTYTMICNLVLSELEKNGFDSYIGFLHGIKYGRESLALDVLEEFRQYFCDLFVIKLLNRKEIKREDFRQQNEGYFLNQRALRKYFEKFNNEYMKKRKTILDQIDKLKTVILNGEKYSPKLLK